MATLFKTLKNDWSISATVAGFLAVLISYSGPLIIFFQAAQRAHVSTDMMVSWIWGISIGAAVSGIYLSIKYKTPVITAWSAPGTALLVTLFPNISLNEAVAAYITSAIVIFFNWRYRLLRQVTEVDSARRRCGHDGGYSFSIRYWPIYRV